VLPFPSIAVNNAQTKHFFDNRYGTGQSTLDGIIRATNILLAGRNTRRGWLRLVRQGRCAARRGMGANVVVTEVDPIKAVEAVMDGFPRDADGRSCFDWRHLRDRHRQSSRHRRRAFFAMKDGAIVCNSGHFDLELNLVRCARWRRSGNVRPFVEEYKLKNGNRVMVLGEGRLINLAAAEGHPASVMDMSFANQALVG
jgi:adenosylhomocysteinase